MEIIINGRLAAMKRNSGYDYISENRDFTKADAYSLSIIFPLSGCPQNLEIFGHLNRKDCDIKKVVFDAEIRDKEFQKKGALTIIEISDVEAKCQFLERKSAQNYYAAIDELYINELPLCVPSDTSTQKNPEYWAGSNRYMMEGYVALPWVNNASGNIQNNADYDNLAGYTWSADIDGLSFQPYLLFITKKICEAAGYTFDFTAWENSSMSHLIVCNALPFSWGIKELARALPHWTVSEYFEKLEYLLHGEFDIDHRDKSIKFAFTDPIIAAMPVTRIDKVIDKYNAEISEDSEAKYIENCNFRYADGGHIMSKLYSCNWYIEEKKNTYCVSYETMDELVAANIKYKEVINYSRGSNINKLLYAKDIDTYFVFKCIRVISGKPDTKVMVLTPVNSFGPLIRDKDGNDIEIEFIPACIEYTEEAKGNCIFLDFASYTEHDGAAVGPDGTIYQPFAAQAILDGEKDGEQEYFKNIFVAFWNGTSAQNYGKLYCPVIDKISFREDWTYTLNDYSLRINDRTTVHYPVDPKKKYSISFISESLPDIRSVFLISGKRYLSEKITAAITETGMSQLKKGVFYRIKD